MFVPEVAYYPNTSKNMGIYHKTATLFFVDFISETNSSLIIYYLFLTYSGVFKNIS